jgi:hypothetical protein
MEKEKEKEFPANWAGGGDFGPPRCERARAGALAAQLAQLRGATAGNNAVARARTSERGGLRPKFGRRGIPRWFSAVGPVLRRGSGGEARAGAGGHGGGVNWTGGGLWRLVRGGVVAGAAIGCNRGQGGVPRDRDRVVEFKR